MNDKIPEACPGGPGSEMAGKASACEGCPSRSLCESAPKGPDPDIAIIARRLEKVKRKIVILSGKGGVGKSTVTALLTRSLAQDEELGIGLLDIDITGPSADLFMGLKGEEVHKSASGWTPCYVDDIAVMSTGFILDEDKALIWGGARKTGLMKNFLKEVEWDELDYLLIDSPPGTSDEHMGIVTLLSDAGIDGGIIGIFFSLFYQFQMTFQFSNHSLRSCTSRCSEAVTILCKVELKSDWRSREYVWF